MFFDKAVENNDIKKIHNQMTVCFNECETCLDGHGCIKCKDDSYYLPDCSHKKEGWFIEGVNMDTYDRIYKECHSSCLSCDGPSSTDCLSCHPDPDSLNRFPLKNNTCPCKSRYFDNNTDKDCKLCD